jgi:hypothetical protein
MLRGEARSRFSVLSDGNIEQSGGTAMRVLVAGAVGVVGGSDSGAGRQ